MEKPTNLGPAHGPRCLSGAPHGFLPCFRVREVLTEAQAGGHPAYSLVDGLEELPLVLPDFGVIDLLQQLRVFVDQPRFPEDVGRSILDLGKDK